MAFKIKDSGNQEVLHQNSMTNHDLESLHLQGEWSVVEHPDGTIKMKQWTFDGVRLAYADWRVNKPVTVDWQGDMEAVTMQFCLKGRISASSNGQPQFDLGHRQQNTFYGKSASGSMTVNELGLQSFMVQFNKDAFLRIAEGGTDALLAFAERVAAGETTAFATHNLPIESQVQQAIDAVLHCQFSADSLKKVFFLSKVMELLVLQADAHSRQTTQKPDSHLKSDYDRQQIIAAREYMLQHIDLPPSLPELAKIVGLNEFKLKKGYKEMFGNTIFGHLAEARLERSRQVLTEGQKTVSEIADALGYSSVQHFSLAFKKRFGVAPSRVK